MSKKAIEGEVVERSSDRQGNSRTFRASGIIAILVLIIAICILAFILKFVVGFLAIVLQFIVVVAAISLVGLLIYNWLKGDK